jgi:hypothetical protein
VARRVQASGVNKEEIDLGDDDDDDGGGGGDGPAGGGAATQVEEMAVPDAVFGGLKAKDGDGEEAAPVGAKERFKKKQRV